EPAIWSVEIPASAAALAADGAGGIEVWPAGAAAAGFAVSAFGASTLGAAAAAPLPAAIMPSRAPTSTVSPSCTAISARVPPAGAGTSIVTLSVSSSTIGSSAAIASPAFLYHLPTVASATDSPRVGTRISVAICLIRAWLSISVGFGVLFAERIIEERLELRQVLGHQASRRRSGGRPACIAHALMLCVYMGKNPFEIGIDERPRTHILGLFLAPHHLRIAKTRQLVD